MHLLESHQILGLLRMAIGTTRIVPCDPIASDFLALFLCLIADNILFDKVIVYVYLMD